MTKKSAHDHLQQDWKGCSTAVAPNFSRDSLRQLPFDINVHMRVSQPRTRLHRGPRVLCPALMAIPV